MDIAHCNEMTSFDFEVIRAKVKVTVTLVKYLILLKK
jgi:hypothetical protein